MKNQKTTIKKNNKKTHEEMLAYWTPERRANAIPKPLPIRKKKQKKSRGEETDPKVISHPQAPTELFLPEALQSVGMEAHKVSDPTVFPYRAVGKIFFTQNGSDYVGSASSTGDHVLLTAAHCVYDNGGWSSWLHFFPYYPYVFAPNYWPSKMMIYNAWKKNRDFDYDYAMMSVDANMTPSIGHLGLLVNAGLTGQTWKAIGYPAVKPFPGDRMYYANGAFVQTEEQVCMNHNDMTGGCSGGPWLAKQLGNYANGVNSYRPADEPKVMYSPYFDSSVEHMYKKIGG
jgi:V8-like Glu-specific endopeptidase